MVTRRILLGAWVVVSALVAWTISRPARAVERNLAASAQLDYHVVAANLGKSRATGVPDVLDGFTLEAALKLAVDVSEHLSANVKLCYGCHGFEADMAYLDLRAFDELNLRVGRFSPSFGNFNLRHDPANHKLSDKPLPYDMGRMLRVGAWNNGVLPSPFPDNGVEVNGTHWFGETVQLDYAAYAVTGFKQSGPNPVDLNFQESHLSYYVDNNSRPSGGGRLALTGKLSALSDVTAGASAMGGTYDPRNDLTYVILGGDITGRMDRTSLRLEYLVRRQKIDTSSPMLLKDPVLPGATSYTFKHGAFVELEQPLGRDVDLILRFDGMHRTGNVAVGSELSNSSWVGRGTLGMAVAVERNFRVKGSVEIWEFRDAEGVGWRMLTSGHLGAVGTF
jgi:hypothetical protein